MMATMAFPNEVAMIPRFLLLRRFPLWPMIGGGVLFFVLVWLLPKIFPKIHDWLLMTTALAPAILFAVWLVPTLVGKPNVSLLNTFACLVLPFMANGYMIFLLKGFFDSLPKELYEAADLDGASEFRKFWSFTMALSTPILAVIALRAFTLAYSNFMMALVLIPDQDMWTIMVWLFQLQSTVNQSVRYAAIAIAAVPTFVVFVVCQGIIIKGIVVPTEK
jgi:multiple sugar transport system permease protein